MDTILSILTLMSGGGNILQYWMLRAERRRRNAEAAGAELDVSAKIDEIQDQQLEKAYKQITALQDIVDQEREKWVALAQQLSALRTDLLKEQEARRIAELDKCTIAECPHRQPPRV